MPGRSFRDLTVWQESMLLVGDVYKLCARLPSEERFGLSAQLKRAAVSIPSNIAEGARRKRRLPFLYHLEIALGSQAEVEVQIELAKQLRFIPESVHAETQLRVDAVGRMLNGLIESLRPR